MSQLPPDQILHAEVQARLAAIVESSDDAIVSKTLDGIITSWNKGAERIFGYTAEEVIGKSITMLIPPDRQHEEPRILARLRAGERIDHYETVRMAKDGRLLDVSVTISPLRDARGMLIGASKIARDITLQKQVQRELKEAKEVAETASRAKDHFLSVLSHELRTPLTPVLAAISHIESSPNLPSSVLHEQISMMRRNIETEARLVDDLLDVTRISREKVRLHYEVVDAHAVLRNAIAILQSDIDEKPLTLTATLRAKRFHVWADPGRLQQVFMSLLSNAVKFTPEKGSIIVQSLNPNGEFRLEVADTGVGIEPDVLPRLFKPFVQGERGVTRKFGGLGLGLSIVKSLVEMHGGSVTASSEGAGKGARFVVELDTLPAFERTLNGRPESSAAAHVFSGHRILLVEDHADTRQVLARLLESFGFMVAAAGSVREALDLSEQQRFDLLVSDIGLPDGSGTEIMRQLKQRQEIKGIALSGFGQDEDLRRSAEAGFAKHLTKPVNFHTLREAIMKVAS